MKLEIYIRQVLSHKQEYMPLLLLGDEQETLIQGYLDRGELFVLERNNEPAGVCVVTKEGPDLYEVQNIAVLPSLQRKGFGRMLIDFVWRHYPDLNTLQLGTGDSVSTISFYRNLGFKETGREADYFLTHYDHPIFDNGTQLKDRILFQKRKAL